MSSENDKKFRPYEPDQSLIKNGQAEIAINDRGPPNSSIGSYYCRLMVGKYERQRPFDPQKWTPSKSIFLPLPSELTDENPVNYSDVNLESVGDLINLDAMTGLGAIALRSSGDAIAGLGTATLTAAFGRTASKVTKLAGNVTGITGDKITSAIQQTVGLAPNPNPSVQFTGPTLREFQFSWVLYPRTPKESQNIDYLIRQLKSSALPSHTFSKSTAILNYPDLCQINFFPWDSNGSSNRWGWTDKSIIRIKKCFIKNVRVSYTEQGNPAFFHGTQLPVMYRISLSLQETEYMLSEDWGGNKWSDPITNSDVGNYIIDKVQGVTNVTFPGSGPIVDILQNAVLGNEGA